MISTALAPETFLLFLFLIVYWKNAAKRLDIFWKLEFRLENRMEIHLYPCIAKETTY